MIKEISKTITTGNILSTLSMEQITSASLVKISFVKQSPILLNKQGNMFQGFPSSRTISQSEAVPAETKERSVRSTLYNPLNRHGNMFQGFGSRGTTTSSTVTPVMIKKRVIKSASTSVNSKVAAYDGYKHTKLENILAGIKVKPNESTIVMKQMSRILKESGWIK